MSRHLSVIAITALILTACLASWATPDNSAPTLSPAPRLENSYQLGLGAYSAQASVVALDETVRKNSSNIKALAALAIKTRTSEMAGYKSAVAALTSMGAPSVVENPYKSAVSGLAAPLVINAGSDAQTPDEPMAQTILSTIDEAGRIAPDRASGVGPWLSLSQGRDGLWAYHLGRLIASIRADIPCSPGKRPLIGDAAGLAASAPIRTPTKLVIALKNLSDLNDHRRVTSAALQALDEAAKEVFESARS